MVVTAAGWMSMVAGVEEIERREWDLRWSALVVCGSCCGGRRWWSWWSIGAAGMCNSREEIGSGLHLEFVVVKSMGMEKIRTEIDRADGCGIEIVREMAARGVLHHYHHRRCPTGDPPALSFRRKPTKR